MRMRTLFLSQSTLWVFEEATHRYRLTAVGAKHFGGKAGTFISKATIDAIRDNVALQAGTSLQLLGEQYLAGNIGIEALTLQGRQIIKDASLQQWLVASGGEHSFTRSEAGKLGSYLRQEYNRYQGLMLKVKNGEITAGQMSANLKMYGNHSTFLYERASALSRGMPEMPTYPADGTQQCLANCKCSWLHKDAGDVWESSWILDASAKHCPDCEYNSGQYSSSNPIITPKPVLARI